MIRERDGRTLTQVFKSEAASIFFIRSRVAKGAEVMADELASQNLLHAAHSVKRINHEFAYSDAGACTKGAEEFFSRLRRAEVGHHHHIAGVCLPRYASEAASRDDHRREANRSQFKAIMALVVKNKPSVDFCGYWQWAEAA